MGDKRKQRERRRDAERDENGRSIYEKVMSGEIEPTGSQKGWSNLRPIPINQYDDEKRKEICRKGAQAVNKLHGEKKTAKQALETILTLKATPEIMASADIPDEIVERLKRDNPNATLYDLIQAVAVGRALDGNMKSYELIRDTYGDKPIDRVEVTDNVTTESDRALMRSIAERLEGAESVQIVSDIPADNVKTEKP